MARLLREFSLVGLFVLLGILAWRWVARGETAPTAPPRASGPVPVVVRTLRPRRVARTVEAFGTLEPRARLPLALEVGGRLEEVWAGWRPGARVAAGELLAALDRVPFQIEVDERRAGLDEARAGLAAARTDEARARRLLAKARESAEVAQREHQRLAGMVEGGVVSDSAVDRALAARLAAELEVERARGACEAAAAALAGAEARGERAEAALAAAEERLTRTRLTAPFAGRLTTRAPEPGTLFAPGALLGELVDLAELRLEARVPSDELLHVREGLAAEVTPVTRPELAAPLALEGVVSAVAPVVDPLTRHGLVEVTVASPLAAAAGAEAGPARTLAAGTFARVRVALSEGEALWIDRRHLVWRDGEPTAFVLQDGVARARALVLLHEHGEGFVVAEGLAAGERLILEPLERLVDGRAAEPRETDRDPEEGDPRGSVGAAAR